jgi:hypothetical protein
MQYVVKMSFCITRLENAILQVRALCNIQTFFGRQFTYLKQNTLVSKMDYSLEFELLGK